MATYLILLVLALSLSSTYTSAFSPPFPRPSPAITSPPPSLFSPIPTPTPPQPPSTIPSQSLAFIGDSVYSLWLRQHHLYPITKPHAYHKTVVNSVKAQAQCKLLKLLKASPTFTLTTLESSVLSRARNSVSARPRNASPVAYQDATSLEALIGFLYLSKDWGRLDTVRGILLEGVDEGVCEESWDGRD